MNNRRLLILSTPPYDYIQSALCAHPVRFERGEVETRSFPDGERYQRVLSTVGGRDVVLVGGTISDEETLRIFDLSCAVVKYGARTLTLVVPYFGYATMERAIKRGEVVTAKSRARLLSAIPTSAAGNRIVLLDLHAAGIPHYFEDHIRAHHLYAKPLIINAARKLGGEDFVLACTDAGRAKWVESLANDLGVSAAFVFKRRLGPTTTEISGISADVAGRKVIIYDDMIRSGSSLLGAAQAYTDAGAASVDAIATHGLFPDDSLEKIKNSGLLGKIICTDSHPRARSLSGDFLEVAGVSALIADHLSGLASQI